MKNFFVLLLILSMLLVSGCNQVSEPEPELPEYEIVTASEFELVELNDWYYQYYREKGQHQYFNDELGDVTYLLISYGEVPTAGYSLELVEEYLEGNQHVFKVRLLKPDPGSMVAQVISYPYILLKIANQEGISIRGILESPDEAGIKDNDFQSDSLLYQGIRGVYIGQIDNNFIEIDLDDTFKFQGLEGQMHDPMSFMLSDAALEMLDFDDGAAVVFDFNITESGSFVILKIASVDQTDEAMVIKGIYTGRIDPSFIEVIYQEEYQVFLYSMIDNESLIEPENYAAVDILYMINEQDQKEIITIEAADPPGLGTALAIEMSGYIESEFEFGVMNIEGQPYWQAYELLMMSSKRMLVGESYHFTYYVDEYGRKVITDYALIQD